MTHPMTYLRMLLKGIFILELAYLEQIASSLDRHSDGRTVYVTVFCSLRLLSARFYLAVLDVLRRHVHKSYEWNDMGYGTYETMKLR